MDPQQPAPTSYRGILPTISQYTPYKPQFEKFTPPPSPGITPMGDNGAAAAQQGVGALAQALGKKTAAPASTWGSDPANLKSGVLGGTPDTFGMFGAPETGALSFAPSSTVPSIGAEMMPGATMSASMTPAAPTIGGSLGWSATPTAMPSLASAGGAGGGAAGAGGSGGFAAAFSNPFTAIPAAIAANEISAYGSDRRPGGAWDQIKFDLMGKAPAADMHALSQKWNLGSGGDLLEGSAKVGASIDPRDTWSGTKQVFNASNDLFSKGLSGLKNFFGW